MKQQQTACSMKHAAHFFRTTLLLVTMASSPSCSPPPAPGLRLLVYNMHAGKDAGGMDNLARIAALVDSLGADVVLLQEVDSATRRSSGIDQPAVLERESGLAAVFGRTLDFQGGGYGIAALSRFPVQHDTMIHLAVDPPQERSGGSYEPRGALRLEIDGPLGGMTVINTHLDPTGDPHWRRQEVQGVLAIVASARESGRIVLLGGDLNTTPDTPEIARLREAGLHDAFVECGTGDGRSFPADSPVKRIDYLFFTGDVRCVEARVLPGQESDHRALFVRLAKGSAPDAK